MEPMENQAEGNEQITSALYLYTTSIHARSGEVTWLGRSGDLISDVPTSQMPYFPRWKVKSV